MNKDIGRDPSGQALVSDHAAYGVDGPSGFDPSRWPRTATAIRRLKEAYTDWRASVLLQKHGAEIRTDRIIRRKSDGTWWVPGAPQSLGYAMLGLFVKRRLDFHFWKVRHWRGVAIVSRRTFWLANSGEFDLLINCSHYRLPPWPMDVECRKIDQAIATETRRAATTGAVEDEGAGPKDIAQTQSEKPHDV